MARGQNRQPRGDVNEKRTKESRKLEPLTGPADTVNVEGKNNKKENLPR